VFPPSPIGLVPERTEKAKLRFLEQLWHAQAIYRTRAHQSVLLRAEEREVETRGGRITIARTYFNIYERTAFLKEAKKTKVVLHIDDSGCADPVPFGTNGPPYVIVRVRPMAGDLCRYAVTSNDPNDEGEEDIVQTVRVPSRVIQTSKCWLVWTDNILTVMQFISLGFSSSRLVTSLLLPRQVLPPARVPLSLALTPYLVTCLMPSPG
jgi:protein ECT2